MNNKKELNLFDLTSIGIGSIIGAGIFSMLMTGMGYTGRSIALAMIFSMLITVIQCIRPLFTASMFALNGGLYSQQALILPPILTGTTTISFVIANLSSSVFGISMAQYLAQLVPALTPYIKLLAVVIITAAFLVSIPGTGFLAKVQNVMVVCLYAALIVFIVFGLKADKSAEAMSTPYFANGTVGFLIAAAIMSYTCNGATNIMNVTSSAKNPKRDVPLAFILASAICALIYFLMAHVASGIIPVSEAAGSTLGAVAKEVMPGGLYVFFVIGGAVFSLATTLLGRIAAISAPIVVSAEDGWLPKVFAKKNKNGYPWVTMLFMYLVAVIPAIFDFSFENIVSYILVPSMIVNVACVICCLKMPKQYPEEWASCGMHCPYWLYCVLLILSMFASLITAVFSLAALDMAGIIGNLAIIVFMFVYSYARLKLGKVDMKSVEDIKAKKVAV